MPIRKIQAGRIITVDSPDFVGERGTLFYDEVLADLRVSDGHTPGGRLINIAGGLTDVLITDPTSGQTLQYNGTHWVNINPGAVGLSTATTTQLGGVKIGENINISEDGTISVSSGTIINFRSIDSDLLPSDDLGYDLGSIDKQWRRLYVGTSTIYMGGVPLKITSDNNLEINGVTVTGPTSSTTTSTGGMYWASNNW